MNSVKYLIVLLLIINTGLCRPSDDEVKSVTEEDNISTSKSDTREEKISYNGAQVLNLQAENVKEIVDELLNEGDAEEWRSNRTHADIFVTKDKASKIKTYLNKKNISYRIVIENVQDAIDKENPQEPNDYEGRQGEKGHRMTWTSYHRLADIYGYLDFLAQTYPNMVTVGSVGKSVEGREIKFIIISSGKPDAKKFWLDGGIHAREWISIATVTYIISELVENRNEHLAVIDGIDFYIVPVVNPDGYEYTHIGERLWRKNRSRGNYTCPGTDLNRNWGYKWGGKGASANNCLQLYRGTGPFSEPETRAVSNFILNNRQNMEAFVTFHSYGQYILIPFHYEVVVLPPDYNELETVGMEAALAMKSSGGETYTVGNGVILLYTASGVSVDWAKGSAGIKYTYTIELRDQGTYGFLLPANYIIPTANEALAGIKAIATAVNSSS